MKTGAENSRKTIIAGVVGAVALLCLFRIYSVLFGGPDTPPPAATTTPVRATAPTETTGSSQATNTQAANVPGGIAPGVQAQKLASANSSLDPTLDERAMLRTESLVYAGTGRNIFSAIYTPPPAAVKKFVPPVVLPPRPPIVAPQGPPLPPPPPPINLKFFGTATRPNGARQAFLLSGDDVYLAAQGEIVARKYKIGTVGTNSVSVTDLTNNNTQNLPLQQ